MPGSRDRLHQASLYRHVKSFVAYYHESRTHLSLVKDAPEPRPVCPPERGAIVAIPQAGGLHHRYERRARLTYRSRPRQPSCQPLRQLLTATRRQDAPSLIGAGFFSGSRRNEHPYLAVGGVHGMPLASSVAGEGRKKGFLCGIEFRRKSSVMKIRCSIR